MSIDLARTRFIISAWPDHRIPIQQVHWFETLVRGVEPDPNYRTTVSKANVVCARNYVVRLALRSPPIFDWFVFIDRDVRPIIKDNTTRQFLDLESDIKVCQVPMREDLAWSRPDSFHEPLWCAHRDTLAAIQPPWFMQRYSADGCAMAGCICLSFREKALEAGFSISHGGWAEHDLDGSWH